MSPRTIFITGGNGFLGSELVNQLLENARTQKLICLILDVDQESRFFSEGMHLKVQMVHGDVRDGHLMKRILVDYDVDTIFHLAAQTEVEKANIDPRDTFETNVCGTWQLLEAARQAPREGRRIILASSDKAYGELSTRQCDEQHPLLAKYPYDVSKACADMIGRSYAESYGLNIGITRCGNIFGPGDSKSSRLFPSTILSLLKNENPVIRSNGKLVRDYIYVSDAAAAYLSLERHMAKQPCKGDAYNFSYGLNLSVLEVVQAIQKQLGTNLPPIIEDRTKNEITVQSLSNEKAKKTLGWKPNVGFEAGISKTIAWLQARHQPTLTLKKRVA